MSEFLTLEILDNPLSAWLTAIGVAIAVNVAVFVLKRILLERLVRFAHTTATRLDDSLIGVLHRTRQSLVFVVALYVGVQFLELAARTESVLRAAAVVAFLLQVGIWAGALLEYGFNRYSARLSARGDGAATSLNVLSFIGKMLLWTVLLLVALDTLGIDVTAMVAGLGIGGVAVALAVQNVLGDLFASLSIVIDKPFVVGDFVVAGEFQGTVEHVGLKTTRLRSISGEQIIFANSDLLQTRLRNFKRMRERRVQFSFAVPLDTPPELLEKIPPFMKRVVETDKLVRFERAHFSRIAESSFEFEVAYWVNDPDYTKFMNIQQAINLAMVRGFAELGVEFAVPTRTIKAASADEDEEAPRLRERDYGRREEKPRAPPRPS